jgi:hypothetical protein
VRPAGLQVAERPADPLDHRHGARLARLRLAGAFGAVALEDSDRGLLEVDVFPAQRQQLAAAQAAERGGQVDRGVLTILCGSQGALGLADGGAPGVAMGACGGGSNELVDLLGGVEVEARGGVGLTQPLDLRGGVWRSGRGGQRRAGGSCAAG